MSTQSGVETQQQQQHSNRATVLLCTRAQSFLHIKQRNKVIIQRLHLNRP